MKAPWRRIWGWLVPQLRTQRLNSSGRSVKRNYWLVIKASPVPHWAAFIFQDLTDLFVMLHFIPLFVCFWTDFRGEPVVCFSSTAGESVQLPRTLLPPTARHCSLPGSLSVHDDKVNGHHIKFKSFLHYRWALLFLSFLHCSSRLFTKR